MGLFDRLTGKDLEAKLSEHGTVFGEVLLGMHRDLTALKAAHEIAISRNTAEHEEIQKQISRMLARIDASVDSMGRVEKLRREVQRMRVLCIASAIVCLGALVIFAVWILR